MIPSLYPCFRHWSEKGGVYIISDTHFDDVDRAIMGYNCTEEEQMDVLKKNVHKNDSLIILGDVGNASYLDELKCHKVLIRGNHDDGAKSYWEFHFDEVYDGPLFITSKILLSHEPIYMVRDYDNVHCYPWVNIHGHCHGAPYRMGQHHYNLAANDRHLELFNLGKEIKKGLVSGVDDIHRITIDRASGRKYI